MMYHVFISQSALSHCNYLQHECPINTKMLAAHCKSPHLACAIRGVHDTVDMAIVNRTVQTERNPDGYQLTIWRDTV